VVPLAGGPTRTVARGSNARWAPNGDLYFHGLDHGVHRAPAGGGPPEVVQEASEVYPENYVWQILPDGESALWYGLVVGPGEPEIAVMELATGEVTPLGFTGWTPTYIPSGHLVFETDSTLMAMPFDPDRPAAGSPVPFVEGISSFSLSEDGTLVYSTFPEVGDLRSNLVRVDREGSDSRILAELDGVGWFPRFSPDGTRLAYGLSEGYGTGGDGSDLWVLDVDRGARTRVTFEGENRWYPVWSPDGSSLTYADAATPENRILTSPADGSGRVETLIDLDFRKFPTSWSPDGSTLAYYQGPQGTDTNSRDIWMLHLDGDEGREEPFITTPFSENGAIFSPDGRWVLYVSDKAGQQDVYALPFPGPGAEVTISVGGGIEPAWGPDGDAIYYRREGELMMVPVDGSGGTLSVGTPRRVMDDDYIRQTQGGAGGVANYAVAPDGGGFVMLEEVAREAEPGRFHVVFNWLEELRERLSVD
jgi:sugar lactone lactonase YvrE